MYAISALKSYVSVYPCGISLQDAQVATSDCLKAFEDVLQKLDDKRKGEISRSMGMKMEQLKGELNQIIDSLRNDEELPTRSTKDT
jgi:hypothetical protein